MTSQEYLTDCLRTLNKIGEDLDKLVLPLDSARFTNDSELTQDDVYLLGSLRALIGSARIEVARAAASLVLIQNF